MGGVRGTVGFVHVLDWGAGGVCGFVYFGKGPLFPSHSPFPLPLLLPICFSFSNPLSTPKRSSANNWPTAKQSASTCLLISSAIITAVQSQSAALINDQGASIGLQAGYNSKFLALTWSAFAVNAASSVVWSCAGIVSAAWRGNEFWFWGGGVSWGWVWGMGIWKFGDDGEGGDVCVH